MKIHRWLAQSLGVFISIVCFTRLVLLFRNEIASAFDTNPKQMPFLVGIKQLHRWLFMISENPCGGLSVGRVIMAVSAMCMTLVLLTGGHLVAQEQEGAEEPSDSKYQQKLPQICL